MADPETGPRVSGPRVSVGVPELDEMLEGGLMPRRPYLIVGPSGTGKTTLALQFLVEGIRRGERALYVTVEDPPNEVLLNHRSLRPLLDKVDVFDAIPDVMRYEHTPFKDIAAVRSVVPFGSIPERIRLTPEFQSVEITGTALEQILRSEVQRRGYTRIVVDSLTALQYFCMKGFEPTVGAQTFIRFLTDLRATTVLTVEAPLEDVESPERMLARGEIRLFRWELDGVTVRAIGVEKFRGSSHDVRLHPYRIGPQGIGVQLGSTISRDTRQIVAPALAVALGTEVSAVASAAELPAAEALSDQIRDLVILGIDVAPLRSEVEAAVAAAEAGRREELLARMTRVSAMVVSLAASGPSPSSDPSERLTPFGQALERVRSRADRARAGVPPTVLPSPELTKHELGSILLLVPSPPAPTPPEAARPAPAARPPPPERPAVPPQARAPVLPATPEVERPRGPAAPAARTPEPELPPVPIPAEPERSETAEAEPVSTRAPEPEPVSDSQTSSPVAGSTPPPPPPVSAAPAAESPPPGPTLDRSSVPAPSTPRSASAAPPLFRVDYPPPQPDRGIPRPVPPAVEMAEGGPPPQRHGAIPGGHPRGHPLPPPPVPRVGSHAAPTVSRFQEAPTPREPISARRSRAGATTSSAPPPLPSVVSVPDGTEAHPSHPPGSGRPPKPAEGQKPAAAPRRRRSSSSKRSSVSSLPTEGGTLAPEGPGGAGGAATTAAGASAEATAKPKRRSVRRKKAPPVVSAEPVGPPPEAPASHGDPPTTADAPSTASHAPSPEAP